MIKLTDIPAEQTAAVTDLILVALAVLGVLYLKIVVKVPSWRRTIWKNFFYLMFIVCMLGAVVHGFDLLDSTRLHLWHILFFFLGFFLMSFTLAIICDLHSEELSKKILPYLMLAGVGFFIFAISIPNGFFGFVVYQFLIMIPVIVGYTRLAFKQKHGAALWMVAAGIFSMIAVLFQVNTNLQFTFIWTFDHNGIYHLVQSVGVLLFIVWLMVSFKGEQ
ncbi:hypothetical protein [Microbulbifer sp. GL-2]|uniref:DUF6962 family protein n=1 Tax=Microbulbifer sp. GL-2 TaxID=2591606 RepID=UPI00117F8275|nr:hypothetical protein [Microbulbifer sp. GL-2]